MYVITPKTVQQPWCWWEDAFKDEELDVIEKMAATATIQGQAGGQENLATRRSKISWLYPEGNHFWIFERLAGVASQINAQHYQFDLTGFGEGLQLTRYDAADRGEYEWHQDCGAPVTIARKLSLTLQLTDPSKYEGGLLELLYGSQPVAIPKRRGYIAIFPSYQLHRVTPLVQGSRHSLVAWICGPQFR
jgi:PKHD-type hydroxylase